ncbi:MAG: hypothetical protein Q4D42_13575, partial [Eubacteriales bacterium]|nr:hypothetical protein [Eubacteriales bacterium]
MKNKIKILLYVILLTFSLCGCSNHSSAPSIEQSSDRIGAEDIKHDTKEYTMIEKTKESIAIFVELLGTESKNGDITVTDEFLDNMESVYIMGRTGTIVHGFGDDMETIISIMEWTDNDSASKSEF